MLHDYWPAFSFTVTADASQLVPLLRQQPYALIVLDSALGGSSLVELLRQLRSIRSCQQVLVLVSQRFTSSQSQQLLQAGAAALLPYNAAPSTVVSTIAALLSGATGGISRTVSTPHRMAPPTPFSQREVEVLRLVVADYCNQEIADQLCLSVRTVESHRRALLQKTGAKTLVGLVVQAVREGWVGVS